VLSLWQGQGGDSSAGSTSPSGPAAPQKVRESLWWYVLLFAFAFAISESVLASRYLGTLREDT